MVVSRADAFHIVVYLAVPNVNAWCFANVFYILFLQWSLCLAHCAKLSHAQRRKKFKWRLRHDTKKIIHGGV